MTIWVTAPQTAERNQGHGCQWGGMQIHVRALPSCFPIPLPPIDSWTTPRKLWVGSSNPLQIILFKWYLCYSQSHSVMSNSCNPVDLYSPWNSPGQNTGVGSLSLLQGIFPTQGSNPGILHCRWILCQLSHREALWCYNRKLFKHRKRRRLGLYFLKEMLSFLGLI